MVREFSTGGAVFKRRQGKILWLITKSSPSNLYPESFWRFPKGWIDDRDGGKNPGPFARGEKKADEKRLQEAALREVREEGGVDAKIVKKIGTERWFFTKLGQRVLKFVTFYLMEWLQNLPEGPGFETEKIEWLEYDAARNRLSHSSEKKILEKARRILDSGVQEGLV